MAVDFIARQLSDQLSIPHQDNVDGPQAGKNT